MMIFAFFLGALMMSLLMWRWVLEVREQRDYWHAKCLESEDIRAALVQAIVDERDRFA